MKKLRIFHLRSQNPRFYKADLPIFPSVFMFLLFLLPSHKDSYDQKN